MLIWMDGFDSYNNAVDLQMAYLSAANYNGNNIGLGTTSGRFGQGGVIFTNYANTLLKSFTDPQTELWMGFAFNNTASSNIFYQLITIFSIISCENQILYNPVTGEWISRLGETLAGNTTPPSGAGIYPPITLASANYSIGTNSWHFIEYHYKISNSGNGIVELWIDGIQIFNNTSANTSISGNNVFYSIMIGGTLGDYSALFGTFDDWYIINPNDGGTNIGRLGDSRIETLVPISDAGPNQGTPLVSGPHYEMVNESQNNNGSTFITMPPTPYTEEVFGMSSLSSIPLNIWAVRVLNIVEKTDGGITRGNAIIRSGNVTAYGPDQQILSTFFGQYGIFELDPNTDSEWTFDSVNAADAGFSVY